VFLEGLRAIAPRAPRRREARLPSDERVLAAEAHEVDLCRVGRPEADSASRDLDVMRRRADGSGPRRVLPPLA